MEAAEERGDELQRMLDASRAAEYQSRCLLRSLQSQQRQNKLSDQEEEESVVTEEPARQEAMTVCRLVDDLAEVEERLHLVETEWKEEKRKRIQLEAELVNLQENQRHQSISTSNPASIPAPVSLSLSEELLISTDFTQWAVWDGRDEELCSESSSGFSEENRSVPKSTQTDPAVVDDPSSDVKSLFREIFAVIKQNI